MSVGDQLAADRPLRRDPVDVVGVGDGRGDAVDVPEGQKRRLAVVEVGIVLERLQVAGQEALQDQVVRREARLLDLGGHPDGELRRRAGVEVGIGRVVVDLEVDPDALARRQLERLDHGRHLGPAVVAPAEVAGQLVGAEDVDLAVAADLGERPLGDEAGAVRRPLQRGVVHDHRPTVGRHPGVHLEHEAGLGRMAERRQRVLGVGGAQLAVDGRERPAAMGVDVGRRGRHRAPGEREHDSGRDGDRRTDGSDSPHPSSPPTGRRESSRAPVGPTSLD